MNCAALPDTLIESELFGHEKGLAYRRCRTTRRLFRTRKRRAALLLDEIGEMPIGTQAKLLRVLEERKTPARLGGTREIARWMSESLPPAIAICARA